MDAVISQRFKDGCSYFVCISISLRDIHFLPTRSKFTFFRFFSTFGLMHQNVVTCGGGGGGMCMLFENCEKRPFQKCMGWWGVGGHRQNPGWASRFSGLGVLPKSNHFIFSSLMKTGFR